MSKKLKQIIPLPGSPESNARIAENCKESKLVFTQPPSETYLARTVHELSAVTEHLKLLHPDFPPIPNGKLFTFTVADHRLWI